MRDCWEAADPVRGSEGYLVGLAVTEPGISPASEKLVPTTPPDSSSPILDLRLRLRQRDPARDTDAWDFFNTSEREVVTGMPLSIG